MASRGCSTRTRDSDSSPTRVPFFGDSDSDSDSLVGDSDLDSDLEVQDSDLDSDSPLWYSIRGFSACSRVGVADCDLSLSNRRYRYRKNTVLLSTSNVQCQLRAHHVTKRQHINSHGMAASSSSSTSRSSQVPQVVKFGFDDT